MSLKILGIESTCDESGISLIEVKEDFVFILSNLLASQIKIHSRYGGVVPSLAAREHKKNLPFLFKKLIKNFPNLDFDFISFSFSPGLAPALLEGKRFTFKIASKFQKKIMPVNHLLAHLFISLLKKEDDFKFKILLPALPAIGLLISGGHTEIFIFDGSWPKVKIKMIGETLDDAVGEAFDKVARLLGFSYPGGPKIEKLAQKVKSSSFKLPRPMIFQKNYNFSFSGLKTAVYYLIKKQKKINLSLKKEIAYEFQQAVFETLLKKTQRALKDFSAKSLIVGGGVSANQTLKEYFLSRLQLPIFWPEKKMATDNGLMIALAGWFYWQKGKRPAEKSKIDISPQSLINF